MSKADKAHLAAQRAYSLATITLTRRADLYVSSAPDNYKFDVLVDILKNGTQVNRQFGVEVIGSYAAPSASRLIQAMKPKFRALQSETYSLPVFLLLFSMPSDDGYFAWVSEPTVEDNLPNLQRHEAPLPFPLTTNLLNDIVNKIDLWYNAKGIGINISTVDRTPTGRQALNHIIDLQASFAATHKKPPRLLRLPLLLAYDIAKLGRDDLGDLSQRILVEGVKVLEKEGLLGMKVKIENALNEVVLE